MGNKSARRALLELLRMQRDSVGARYFSRVEAPELFELACAVESARRGARSIVYRGVRFPLRHGFRRYVIDPENGETLTAGGFLT